MPQKGIGWNYCKTLIVFHTHKHLVKVRSQSSPCWITQGQAAGPSRAIVMQMSQWRKREAIPQTWGRLQWRGAESQRNRPGLQSEFQCDSYVCDEEWEFPNVNRPGSRGGQGWVMHTQICPLPNQLVNFILCHLNQNFIGPVRISWVQGDLHCVLSQKVPKAPRSKIY